MILTKLQVIRAVLIGIVLAGVILGLINYGRKDEQVKQAVEIVQKVEKANAVRNKNRATLDDGDAVKRVRSDWSR
jgi:hypothetical protein